MTQRKYHYEYAVFTDNLCYGRMPIGNARTRTEAEAIGQWAGMGVFIIEKHRVYHHESK